MANNDAMTMMLLMRGGTYEIWNEETKLKEITQCQDEGQSNPGCEESTDTRLWQEGNGASPSEEGDLQQGLSEDYLWIK